MSDQSPPVRVVLELGHAPSGEPAAHVLRLDVPTDYGTVWLMELPVLLESLLLHHEADHPASTDSGPAEVPAPQAHRAADAGR